MRERTTVCEWWSAPPPCADVCLCVCSAVGSTTVGARLTRGHGRSGETSQEERLYRALLEPVSTPDESPSDSRHPLVAAVSELVSKYPLRLQDEGAQCTSHVSIQGVDGTPDGPCTPLRHRRMTYPASGSHQTCRSTKLDALLPSRAITSTFARTRAVEWTRAAPSELPTATAA